MLDNNTESTTLNNTTRDCFTPNDYAYPLCKGNKNDEKCHDCCLYEDYEDFHPPYFY